MIKYSDIAIKGNKNPKNTKAVLDAVSNILNTRVGERVFNRDFGSNLEDYLFEPFSFVTSRLIFSEIIRTISRWEDRVEILISDSSVKMDPDNRKYLITIALKIKGFDNIVFYNDELKAK